MHSMNSTYSINTFWEDGEEGVRLAEGWRVAGIGQRAVGLGRQGGVRGWMERERLTGSDDSGTRGGWDHTRDDSRWWAGGKEKYALEQLTSVPETS